MQTRNKHVYISNKINCNIFNFLLYFTLPYSCKLLVGCKSLYSHSKFGLVKIQGSNIGRLFAKTFFHSINRTVK